MLHEVHAATGLAGFRPANYCGKGFNSRPIREAGLFQKWIKDLVYLLKKHLKDSDIITDYAWRRTIASHIQFENSVWMNDPLLIEKHPFKTSYNQFQAMSSVLIGHKNSL